MHVRDFEKAVALYSFFPVFLNHARIHENFSLHGPLLLHEFLSHHART